MINNKMISDTNFVESLTITSCQDGREVSDCGDVDEPLGGNGHLGVGALTIEYELPSWAYREPPAATRRSGRSRAATPGPRQR
jgi:hypothetical protein